jgi:hypothetical protein
MSEFYRNGLGYVDPTAYQALKAAVRTVGGVAPSPGDIWEADLNTGKRKFLVIAAYKDHASTLILNNESRGVDNVEITTDSGAVYYVVPAMLSFKFYEDFTKKEDELTPEEFHRLQWILADCLGLVTEAPENQDNGLRTKYKAAQKTIAELTVARDLYREEYRELLAHLIGK